MQSAYRDSRKDFAPQPPAALRRDMSGFSSAQNMLRKMLSTIQAERE